MKPQHYLITGSILSIISILLFDITSPRIAFTVFFFGIFFIFIAIYSINRKLEVSILTDIYYWCKGIFIKTITINKIFGDTYVMANWSFLSNGLYIEVNKYRIDNNKAIFIGSDKLAELAIERCVHNIERHKFNSHSEPIEQKGLNIIKAKAYKLGIKKIEECLVYNLTTPVNCLSVWIHNNIDNSLLKNYKWMGVGVMEDTKNNITICLLLAK